MKTRNTRRVWPEVPRGAPGRTEELNSGRLLSSLQDASADLGETPTSEQKEYATPNYLLTTKVASDVLGSSQRMRADLRKAAAVRASS